MPGFDGTGPRGMGPMTGGARGVCNSAAAGYGGFRGYGYRNPGFAARGGWTTPNAMPYAMPYAMGYNRFANPWYGGAYGSPYGGYGSGGWNMPFGMYGSSYRPFYGFGRGLGPCGMGMAWGRRGGRGRGRW